MTALKKTSLHALHIAWGAKMVPFAGYDMPVQYPTGVMTEHSHTRSYAGLFDVSHMGQLHLRADDYATAARALEALIPVDILGLAPGRQRYGFFTNPDGGISDDLMLANCGDHISIVVNAACKAADTAYLKANMPAGVDVVEIADRALLALQGPLAGTVMSKLNPAAIDMSFMDVATLSIGGVECWVSRSGYTGEDGFEISVPADAAADLARVLTEHPDVAPIGLGARDSLRLEAGLCLYGHDIDDGTSPVEAALQWAIQKVRRAGGDRAGGFPGADRISQELEGAPTRRRVGLRPDGRAPMREGVLLFDEADAATPIGQITSGGFGPTIGGPVAMGYVTTPNATKGETIYGELRGKRLPLTVVSLPFVPANFKR